MTDHRPVDYPECAKIKAAQEESVIICNFLSWLMEIKGYEIVLAEGQGDFTGIDEHDFENLMAIYFNIDLQKAEKEKRKILEEFRLGNK